MRILIATDHYPPTIGGAEIQSRLLAQQLRDRDHDVTVATVWQHGMPSVREEEGIRVYRLRQLRTLPLLARKWRHHQPPFPDPVTAIGLRRIIAKVKPQIVHSYGWFSYSCAAALVGSDIPLVLTARDYAYSCPTRTLLYKGKPCSGPGPLKCVSCAAREYGRPKGWVVAAAVHANAPLLRRKVRAVHSISNYVDHITRRDFLVGRSPTVITRVIHDPVKRVSDEYFESREGQERLHLLDQLPDEPFLLFVGALRRVKGVEQLLAAYQSLRDPPPLVLMGTLEPDSPQDFPAGVRIITDVPHEAVMAAWKRCLFGVLPSLLPEPFGTVVGEAMSCGKAVIGTVPGGHRDMIVSGETGFLVPAGDVQALANAMQQLISSADLRERFGEAARARARLFTPEVTIPQVEQLYAELMRN